MSKIIDSLNQMLLESEQFSNDFLPLSQTLTPIKADINSALEELKFKAENSTEIADRIFYLNRYTDLLKKLESIFDSRSRRLQTMIQTLSKLNLDDKPIETSEEITESSGSLTPEQCSAIIKILNKEEK